MEYIVELRGIRKVYRMGDEKVVALDNINLALEKEKFYCFLGTSGSGKSTLLNLIAGLEKPSRGQIIINKRRIEAMSENQLARFRQKHIGFVFQSYNLMPTLTALENVSLPLIFQNVPRKAREKKAALLLKAVGLGNRLRHRPSQMSGGQQQRVSIARAFIGDPQIIIADEPTGNLDTKTTVDIMKLITTIAREKKQTLVVVTHDREIAVYADEIIYLRDGNIEKVEKNLQEHGGVTA
ncbi:MAG: ABC transporter ATP-binding protein [bacterium]